MERVRQEFFGETFYAKRPPFWRRWSATGSNGMAMGNASLLACLRERRRRRLEGVKVTIRRQRVG